VNTLASGLDTIRLSLHVLAATVWVGGQITLLGLLPDLRRLGGDASVKVARAFARISWPAFAVLVITGFWNIAAVHASHSTHAWKVVLAIKIAVVALAGIAALVHARATTRPSLAAWGSIAGTMSIAAVVLGVLLTG
jgi:putative copper export protein